MRRYVAHSQGQGKVQSQWPPVRSLKFAFLAMCLNDPQYGQVDAHAHVRLFYILATKRAYMMHFQNRPFYTAALFALLLHR
jgi:hypothetical protein